jgi:hypothetical protein
MKQVLAFHIVVWTMQPNTTWILQIFGGRMVLVKYSHFNAVARLLYKRDNQSKVSKNSENEDGSIEDDWSDSMVASNDKLTTIVFKKSIENLFDAWASPRIQYKRSITNGEEYKFVYSILDCHCCFSGTTMLTIGNQSYLNACQNTGQWYKTDFISSFVSMCAHVAHLPNIHLVLCRNPKAIITKDKC